MFSKLIVRVRNYFQYRPMAETAYEVAIKCLTATQANTTEEHYVDIYKQLLFLQAELWNKPKEWNAALLEYLMGLYPKRVISKTFLVSEQRFIFHALKLLTNRAFILQIALRQPEYRQASLINHYINEIHLRHENLS
jgi:hypothetical protein